MSKNKNATLIALFLMLTVVAALITFLPTASAAETNYYSYVYCSVSPDVVGVGQKVLITYWTSDMPPDIGEIVAGAGERAAWYDVGWYVTDPEGNTETIPIKKTDPVGGSWIEYTPDQLGTYTVQAWFPETDKELLVDYFDMMTGTFYFAGHHFIYSAAVSLNVTFTVQEEQREPWPEAPLPNDYWTRPINQASRSWYVLAGNWLTPASWTGSPGTRPAGTYGGTTERFVYGEGPESAHILWTKPYYVGGIMDERYDVTGYQTGHYQGMEFEAIIINGQIYYKYRADAHRTEGYLVVDLYTGETLRYVNDTIPSRAQIYNYESPNQHGGYAYMWKTSGVTLPEGDFTEMGKETWEMLDAYTGKSITKIANVSSAMFSWFTWTMVGGVEVYGLDGSIAFYDVANIGTSAAPDYRLTVWNNTAMVSMLLGPTGTDAWQWRPEGNPVHDGNTGFSLNVSIPASYVEGPKNTIENQTGSVRCVREGEYIIVGTNGINDERGTVQGQMTFLSLEQGNEGTKLRGTPFTPPYASLKENVSTGIFFGGFSMTGVYPEDDVILFESSKQLKRWGYSLETGEQLWESEPEPQMNYYTLIANYYDGKLLTCGYGGVILAYNITTGDILWNYTAKNVGWESPYGNYPINIFAICDGKIYTLTGEHSITQPMWRGPNIRCINATDGTEIWSMLGFGANGGAHLTGQYMQMADGKVVGLNYFDNQIYCIGRGSSATTVSAPELVPTVGSSVMITGTVTDQTETGRRNTNDMFDFTLKGTPAISDEDMSAWMEYLFMNQGRPADAKGVEVVLETLDPNGNFYEIGNTTSDINGNYGIMWEPPVPGEYQIIATFAGSAAYGPSYATTYMGVAEAPEPTPAPTPTPAPMTDTYVLGIGAGAIIAIIAVGLVLILMMRKR
jgi:hypothetical protein